jgi:hypothetical protein
MHSLLGIVFDDEAKANDGKQALLQLEAEGGVIIHGYALLAKHSDGSVTVSYEDEHRPFFTFPGAYRTKSGSSGEARKSDVATAGLESPLARAQWDNSRIYGVIEDLKKVMLANRVVLAADLDEEFPVSVDSTMESRGGIVFRWVVEE